MPKCEWNECQNNATKVVTRNTTKEEKERSMLRTERGVSWEGIVPKNVCDDHLEEARREYPFIANMIPK